MHDKAELRAHMRRAVADWLLLGERAAASERICSILIETPAWRAARRICVFVPLASEPDIAPLWIDPSAGKAFCFPRLSGDAMELVTVDKTDFPRLDWRMRHPSLASAAIVPLESVDLILVPGLAFTANGERLGRGGGHYDRLLARRSPHTVSIGVCFHTQILDSLPREPHDVPVDVVVTERLTPPEAAFQKLGSA